MREVVIAGACRTAIGTFGGGLKGFSAVQLGTFVIAEALKRAGVRPEAVGEVVMGHVLQAGLGENPARQCGVNAGVPIEVPAFTVNKVCGSGLKAVALGAQAIAAGEADVVVAGGMESMTNAPYLVGKARWGIRMGDEALVDSMLRDGLLDPWTGVHMGITAENVAERFGISRSEQDALASESIRRALHAIDAGHFRDEIVPVEVAQRKGPSFVFDTDELPGTRPAPDVMAPSVPPSSRTGRSPPATPRASTTGRRPWCCWPRSERTIWESRRSPVCALRLRPVWSRASWAPGRSRRCRRSWRARA